MPGASIELAEINALPTEPTQHSCPKSTRNGLALRSGLKFPGPQFCFVGLVAKSAISTDSLAKKTCGIDSCALQAQQALYRLERAPLDRGDACLA